MANEQTKLSDEARDRIVKKATEVCRWVGWIALGRCPEKVRELKALIEEETGLEIEEKT